MVKGNHRCGGAVAGVLAGLFCLVGSVQAANAQAPIQSKVSSSETWPADIDRKSGFRLPLLNREDLDEEARRIYDRATAPGSASAGLHGPSGILLYSPRVAATFSAINRYLRREAGLSGREQEIAILVTAREFNSQFEWSLHEGLAKKEGVPNTTIDAIKHRRSLDATHDATDAVIVELGRQLWRDQKVTSETFTKAKELFGPKKLLDIVVLMGNYASTAALLTVVDMQLPVGEASLLPEGR